jgi:protease-4
MKQFFKFTFASILGFIIGSFILVFILGAMFASLVSVLNQKEVRDVPYNSVLHITFTGPVLERTDNNPLNAIDLNTLRSNVQPGLNEILKSIDHATSNDRIRGVVIETSDIDASLAALSEIRDALTRFRAEGKFVAAYSDLYSQKAYYLSSVSDELWMNPEGFVWFAGLSSQGPFFRGVFDKLGIEPQVIRKGKFKSAAEPFSDYAMSPENKEQVMEYTEAIWNNVLDDISKDRSVSADDLRTSTNGAAFKRAGELINSGMITNTGYRDQFVDMIADRLELTDNRTPSFIPLHDYCKVAKWPGGESLSRDKVAVIYATGNIVDGGDEESAVTSSGFAREVLAAGKDERIKAIVLRVNSPGGSSIASESILHAVNEVKKSKPVIVSMGGVAASGGYYISCSADTIIANKNTLTGSIGVIGIMFNAREFLNDRLGITFDGYKTGPYADFPNFSRSLSEGEKEWIGAMVDTVYNTFIGRVSDHRGMGLAAVDSIAQGKVWVGNMALDNGLVDMNGGLLDAIRIAAGRSGLDNYRVVELPVQRDPIVRLMEDLGGASVSILKNLVSKDELSYIKRYEQLRMYEGVNILLPFNFPVY